MIRVARDKAKLGDTSFIRFWVWLEPSNSSNEKASVCGGYWDPVSGSWNSQKQPIPDPTPATQAFELIRQFALKKGFSAIWIDDARRLFVDVGLWVRNGLIDYLDDHS
jgi:hypothetical protein